MYGKINRNQLVFINSYQTVMKIKKIIKTGYYYFINPNLFIPKSFIFVSTMQHSNKT